MNGLQPKRPRVRLEPELYKHLCLKVMKRDGWRCQICGSGRNLQVHHKQLRSQQGLDDELNLISLCAGCHERLHRPPLKKEIGKVVIPRSSRRAPV